jgi:hypothetical protein
MTASPGDQTPPRHCRICRPARLTACRRIFGKMTLQGFALRPGKNGRRILSLYLKVKYNIRRRESGGVHERTTTV